MAYRLTHVAEAHIDAVLLESARTHGAAAAVRYARLIFTTLSALGHNGKLIGSITVPGLAPVRAYPIRLSRMRVEPAHRVRSPRHLVLYREAPDGVLEILGLVHDRMVLSRAARSIVRHADQD